KTMLAAGRAARAEHFALLAVDRESGGVRAIATPDADVSAPLYRPDGRGIVYHVNADGEVSVVAANVDGSDARVVSPAGGVSTVTGFAPNGAVAYVLHVGRVTPPVLYETQLLASAGHHVLAVNYRGSTGYGAAFEHDPAGDRERVADVLAARDYAVATLGVPTERVFLLGHSYGALVAAEAAAADPDGVGG